MILTHPLPTPRTSHIDGHFQVSDANSFTSNQSGLIPQSNSPDSLISSLDCSPIQHPELVLEQETTSDLIHTLNLYRTKLTKTSSPEYILEYAKFIIFSVIPCCLDNDESVAKKKLDLFLESHSLLKKAIQRPESQFLLAEQYETGCANKKSKPNFTKAFKLYMKAAKHNHIESIYRVSVYYEAGQGTSKSNSRALQFFLKAAAVGHPGACFRLGMAELQGHLGLDKNPRNGIKWLKHSVANATPEHCQGLYELALLHEVGIEHVVFVDYEYSVSLLQQAASLGHVPSMFRLGSYYEHGNFVDKDPCTSFHYYKAAAERGHKESMFGVASWYLTGHDEASVPQSDELAFSWMLTVAKLGLTKAFFALGYLYEEGIGTPVNIPEAKAWYQNAISKSDMRAKPRLSAIILHEKKSHRASLRRSQNGQQTKGRPLSHQPPPTLYSSSPTSKAATSNPNLEAVLNQQRQKENRDRIVRERTGEDACVIM